MVEQRTENPRVGGSIPPLAILSNISIDAGFAAPRPPPLVTGGVRAGYGATGSGDRAVAAGGGHMNINGLISSETSVILSTGSPARRACSRIASGLGASYSQ